MIENAQIEQILSFYKCPCNVITSRSGGGFWDYFLQPLGGTTINKLNARVNDFTIAIGKAVTIAIENMNLIFRIKDGEQATQYNYFENSCNLDKCAGMLAIGVNPCGGFVQYNLFDMPHMLVAGATGSGKSVFLHSVIVSLAINGGVALRLIDLKRVTFSKYNGLHFVDGDAVTDAQSAERVLREEVREMEARYKTMEHYGVENYKDLPEEKKLKARVVIIDELCDLMLNRETRRSVENSIVRIAQLGRAAGCHLILATQRPSTNVVTGLIKANIPCKIAFMTSNAVDARVIGCKGAEHLNGKGDALLSIAGKKELERVQAFYISDCELSKLVEGVRAEQAPPTPPKTVKKGFFQRLFT